MLCLQIIKHMHEAPHYIKQTGCNLKRGGAGQGVAGQGTILTHMAPEQLDDVQPTLYMGRGLYMGVGSVGPRTEPVPLSLTHDQVKRLIYA